MQTIKSRVLTGVAGLALFVAGFAATQEQRPARDVSPVYHANIAAAQKLCREAWQRVVDAQRANQFDLGGHAQKAKALLDQVNDELRLAADVSNANH